MFLRARDRIRAIWKTCGFSPKPELKLQRPDWNSCTPFAYLHLCIGELQIHPEIDRKNA